jgi:hypothetical protein
MSTGWAIKKNIQVLINQLKYVQFWFLIQGDIQILATFMYSAITHSSIPHILSRHAVSVRIFSV